jgi:phosphoserine aminotransferase
MVERIYNFSAGPAVLPEPVLEKAQASLMSLGNTGVGVCEHSHRGPAFTQVYEDAEANCRELAGIPDNYRVLFLQGGASSQFFMIPMNLLDKDQTADYLVTGAWAKKAIAEAGRFGTAHETCSSADRNFSYIPTEMNYSDSPAYVHYTSNNTIFGTQFTTHPDCPDNSFLVCDASSDIFSRPIDVAKYGVIYAGAQKNLGPSGVTLVIIRDDLIENSNIDVPTMLQYRTHAEKQSMFNTPPTFGIYLMGEVFKWIQQQGGLSAMAELNQAKAEPLYQFLDESKLFTGAADSDCRSLMNVTFVTGDENLDAEFVKTATAASMSGLKGHRSVGGMRASIYNAFPASGVEALVALMKEFETKHG